MRDFRKPATPATELHQRIRLAWQDLEQARLESSPSRTRAAEHTMNRLLDQLGELMALGDPEDKVA